MATISRYDTSAGKRWEVRYRTPERKTTRKRGFTSKRQAQDFAATVEVEKMRGEYVPPQLGYITIGEIAPAWLERKAADLKPSAYRSLEGAWRVHVKPRWADVRISDIDLDAVERWISSMSSQRGATVVIRAYGVLAGILDSAVKSRRLARNPARGVENLPRKGRKARVYLTHEQVDALADAAGDKRALVYVLAYCGLRWGEAIGLRVRHLDLLRKRLTVVENAVQVDNHVYVGTPKSHTSRTVPVPDFLLLELARQCEGRARDDLLFPGRDGDYLRRPVSFTGWFQKAVEKSGVPRVTPHDLRHTCASLAVQAGAHVKSLQRMLGHASAAMTLDTYSDLFDDDLDAVGDALHQARSAPIVSKACPPS
ncbi:tyrosine-type recombinase/integrase [Rhodococcus pyridinivorans]|uniref:tyrosine-type recombinase/integrase n=1 Tax=Rhodococcus pyridinivorans TaxID=103816 RepID=UPI0036880900